MHELLINDSMANQRHIRNTTYFIIFLILVLLFIQTVVFRGPKPVNVARRKLIWDYEDALCGFHLTRKEMVAREVREECPVKGIVTTFYGGGLDSQMWAYASVAAAARKTSLLPFIPICIHSYLSQVFEDLGIPSLSDISHCDIPLPVAAQSLEDWSNENQSIVLPVFTELVEYAVEYYDDLIREFHLKQYLLDLGNDALVKLARKPEPTYVGVYLPENWDNGDGIINPDNEFYIRAFDRVRSEKNNTVFVVVSETRFKPKNFLVDDVFFFKTNIPSGLNLALLSMCNVSILGYNGLGLWGAILSGNDVLVFDASDDRFGYYLNNLPQFRIV